MTRRTHALAYAVALGFTSAALSGCSYISGAKDTVSSIVGTASEKASEISGYSKDLLEQAKGFGAGAQSTISTVTQTTVDAAEAAREAIAGITSNNMSGEKTVTEAQKQLEAAKKSLANLGSTLNKDQLKTIEAERDRLTATIDDLMSKLETASNK